MSEVNEFSVYILLHIHLLISKVRSRQTYGIPLLVFHRYHFLLNKVRLHIPMCDVQSVRHQAMIHFCITKT